MILINETFSIVTPESAENRDIAECGTISEDTPYTFRELVDALRYGESSCWPARGDISEWVSQSRGETRKFFENGEEETRSFHYSRNNPPRNEKYWRAAFRAAGLTK